MIITTSNILNGASPTVSEGSNPNGTPEDVVNEDFSLNYTGTSKSVLTFDFGATQEINYVAVAGITNATSGSGLVTVLDGSSVISSVSIVRNNCVVISFGLQPFSNLRVRLTNSNADIEPTLSYVAAGLSFEVPNGGEVAGYNRQWLNRGIKSKVTSDQISAPVALIRSNMSLKGNLNLPNMTTDFCYNQYQDFLDFATENIFFINEGTLLPQSSYCCFEITPKAPTAHSGTRSLNNVSFGFKVFNGL